MSESSLWLKMKKTDPTWRSWNLMIRRCNDKSQRNYSRYGGRGIKVCDRWRGSGGFQRFLADMGPRSSVELSLDRIDVNGNYEPGNCRWATKEQQDLNRRSTIFVVYNGQRRTLVELARELGIDSEIVSRRLRYGWDLERALTFPVRRRSRRTVRSSSRQPEPVKP